MSGLLSKKQMNSFKNRLITFSLPFFFLLCFVSNAQIKIIERGLGAPAPPQLIVYPNPPIGTLNNSDFSVRVKQGSGDWYNLFEYMTYVNSGTDEMTYKESSFVYFDFTGTVTIEVTSNSIPISSVLIRPINAGITPAVLGNKATFTINKALNLSFEVNGNRHENLQIFANKPFPEPDPELNVITVDSMNNRRCVRPDQSGVYNWFCPENGETIYIAGGEVFNGSIYMKNKENVTIIGRGVINQTGFSHNFSSDTSQVPKPYYWMNGIQIDTSRSIKIEGVIINDPQHHIVKFTESKDIEIKDVKVFSRVWGGDGFHNVASSDVTIENCFLRTSDDAIAIYPFREREWKTWLGNAKNISVKNTVLYADKAHAIEIGATGIYEGFDPAQTDYPYDDHILPGDKAVVENINFENIDILEQDQNDYAGGIYQGAIGINCGDNNYCQFIRFKDIRVEDITTGCLFKIKVEEGSGQNGGFTESDGYRVQSIVFDGLEYNGSGETSSIITGINSCRYVNGVHFTNFKVNGNTITNSQDYDSLTIGPYVYDLTFDSAPNYHNLANGTYSIWNESNNRSLDRTSQIFDADGNGSTSNDPQNQHHTITSLWGETWQISKLVGEADTYKIISSYNGNALTVSDQGKYYGDTCYDYYTITSPYVGLGNQKWKIIPVQGGYRIISAYGYEYSLSSTPIPYVNYPANRYTMAMPWVNDNSRKWTFTLEAPLVQPISKSSTYNEFNSFTIYPNPTSETLTIKALESLDRVLVKIFDLRGRKMASSEFSGNQTAINVSYLSSGLYLVTIESEGIKIFTEKLIKL